MVTSVDIGKIFKKAREERGLSVEEAYKKSRIHFNVIQDLENGVFDKLSKLYVKSFLKKYSVFLGVDPEKILKEYEDISSQIPERKFTLDVEGKRKRDTRHQTPDTRPRTIGRRSRGAGHKPQAAGSKLQASGHRPQVTGSKLQAAGHRPAEDKKPEKYEQPKLDIRGKVPTLLTEKTIGIGLKAVLAIIFVILLVGLIGRSKERTSLAEKRESAAVSKSARVTRDTSEKTREVSTVKTAPSPKKENTVPVRETVRETSSVPAGGATASDAVSGMPVLLTLKATGKVWVQVKEAGNVVYDGILEEGDSKTLRSNGTFTVWTGKTENLDFYVNTRKVGVVARGVVKDITVSAAGVKVGDDWVARFE